MPPRFPRLFATLAVLPLCSCAAADHGSAADPAAEPQTIEEVVERHVAAMGGQEALDSLDNIDIRFEVVEPAYTLRGRYRAMRDGRMRVDVYADRRNVFSEGIDAAGPWQRAGPGAAVESVTADGAAALRHGVEYNLFGLHRFPERGHALALAGRETVEGIEHYVVQVTLRDGFETYLYLDPTTWLVARRRDVRALHPDVDPEERPLETVYESYGTLCGVRRAERSVQIDLSTRDTVQATRTLEQACNRPEAALDIARPSPAAPAP